VQHEPTFVFLTTPLAEARRRGTQWAKSNDERVCWRSASGRFAQDWSQLFPVSRTKS